MTQSYKIEGMTCNSCVQQVTTSLEQLPEVVKAEAKLAGGYTELELKNPVSLSSLKEKLKPFSKYSIESWPAKTPLTQATDSATPNSLFPLYLVFAYLLGISILSQILAESWNLSFAMRIFMGGFFLTFSFFKLLDIKAFATSFANYDPISKRWKSYAYAYPFIEIVLGLLYLSGVYPIFTNLTTLVLLAIGTVGVAKSLWNKQTIQCACLGTVFQLPMTKVTLFENSLMILMATSMLLLNGEGLFI